MSHPRYQIFVSSTFEDLRDERQAILRAILKLNQIPAGMEIFPAVHDTAWELIQTVIKDSDYYVLIIGGRYGSLDENGISYTEREYDFAIREKIPVLAFLHADPGTISLNKSEVNNRLRKKLESFKKKVQKHHCNFWTTIEELTENVLASLSQSIVINPRTGWVKAGGIEKAELLERLAKLQSEYDRLHQVNRKLTKDFKSFGNSEYISQGDDEILIPIYWNQKTVEVQASWKELFLQTGGVLINTLKASEHDLKKVVDEFLFSKLPNEKRNEEKKEWTPGYYLRDGMGDRFFSEIGNQFLALDMIKTSFGEYGIRCWSLTEKGKKLFARQTAVMHEEINENAH